MRIRQLLSFILLVCLLPSCAREPGWTEGDGRDCLFRLEGLPGMTRSLLTAPDIETKVTSVTLAAYLRDGSGGRLFRSASFSGTESPMTLRLPGKRVWNVYAFVNMGDLSDRLPLKEEDLPGIRFTVPSYTAVNRDGLPMSGRAEGFRSDGDGDSGTAIPVRRLFAKVTAYLSFDWEGAHVRQARVRNLNGSLPLSGQAAALSASDLLDGEDLDTGTDGTFVFYVPENCQGTVPGITDPSGKAPDRNGEVAARQDLLTCLEVTVGLSGTYGGTVTYRSCLGGNATDDFDLKGNTHYLWSVRYHEDGLQDHTWKTDTDDLTDKRYLEWTRNPIRVKAGGTYAFSDYLSSNIPPAQIVKTLSGEALGQMVGSVDAERFTILPSAQLGQECTATARPGRNATPELVRETTVRVGDDRYLYWANQPEQPLLELFYDRGEPEISHGESLLLTGFIMGYGTPKLNDWNWMGKAIRYGNSIESYLQAILPASLFGDKTSGIRTYIYYGKDQDRAKNAADYSRNCGVLYLIHPYLSFPAGDHPITICYKDDPSVALTLLLHIADDGGNTRYADWYGIDPSEKTLDVGDIQPFRILASTHRYVNNRLVAEYKRTFYAYEITWTSSDPAVVSVDGNGTATALSGGTAILTARFLESGKIAYQEVSATVHVRPQDDPGDDPGGDPGDDPGGDPGDGPGDETTTRLELALSPATASISVGGTQVLKATLTTVKLVNGTETERKTTVLPASSLTWQTSDSGTASIREGTVTGLKAGTAVITALYRTDDTSASASARITVTEKPGSNIRVETGWDQGGTIDIE